MKTYRKLLGGRLRSSTRDCVYIEQVREFVLKFDQFRLWQFTLFSVQVGEDTTQATCLLNRPPLPRVVEVHANSIARQRYD